MTNFLKKESEITYTVSKEINNIVSLFKGDITKLEIDGIQNAANTGCLGGGGIDGVFLELNLTL